MVEQAIDESARDPNVDASWTVFEVHVIHLSGPGKSPPSSSLPGYVGLCSTYSSCLRLLLVLSGLPLQQAPPSRC